MARSLSLSKRLLSSSLYITQCIRLQKWHYMLHVRSCMYCLLCISYISLSLVTTTTIKKFFAKCGFPVDHQRSHTSQFKKCYRSSKINAMWQRHNTTNIQNHLVYCVHSYTKSSVSAMVAMRTAMCLICTTSGLQQTHKINFITLENPRKMKLITLSVPIVDSSSYQPTAFWKSQQCR